MNTIEKVQAELNSALTALIERGDNTDDAQEQAAIDDAIDKINDQLDLIVLGDLEAAAMIVAAASEALKRVVDSARTNPLDPALDKIRESISNIATEAVPDRPVPAPEPSAGAGAGSSEEPPSTPAPTPPTGLLPAPQNKRTFAALKDEYQDFYDACVIRPERKGSVDFCVGLLKGHRQIYESTGNKLNDIPWHFIGIIHGMETGFNMTRHLHNGDPLTARTTHVPKGHPKTGDPPFTWEQSAEDAIKLEKLHLVTDWSVPHMLFLWEKYNGFGYRPRGVPSPYLWSFSNVYEKGKFVADGKYDSDAVSGQCGAAVMLKALGV